jgi:leucyl-tRNA synthetase
LTFDEVLLVVQINGKVRGKLTVPAGMSEADAIDAARSDGKIAAYLNGHAIRKTVYVKDRVLNVVVG